MYKLPIENECTGWEYLAEAPKDRVIMGFQHDRPAITYHMMWWEPTSSWEFMKPNRDGTKFVLDQSRDWKPSPDRWMDCTRPRFAGARTDQPKIDWDSLAEGTTIMVTVDGIDYPTIKINNVQRFVENYDHWLVKRLRDNNGRFPNPQGDIQDLHDMAIHYARKKFSKRDYMEMNIALGYSVCGFCDVFPDVDIENPVWA